MANAMELKYTEHPPLFLGSYPLTIGVQLICMCHFLACIVVISLASSVVSATVMGYEASPEVQTIFATWHLLGVAVIASALVATVRRQPQPLQVYFWYLSLTSLALALLMLRIYQLSESCSFVDVNANTQRVGLSFSCGMVSAAWDICSLAILVCAAYACWVVWHLKEDILQRGEEGQHLLDHESLEIKELREKHRIGMKEALGGVLPREEEMKKPAESQSDPKSWVVPQLGPQPPWGTMHIPAATLTS